MRRHYIQTNTVAKMDIFVLANTYTIQHFSTFTACLDTLRNGRVCFNCLLFITVQFNPV